MSVGDTYVGGHKVFGPTVILKPERVRMAESTRVDSFCKIEGGEGVELGEFVHIASFCHLNVGGGTLIIEDHATLSSRCLIGGGTPDWGYLHVSAAEPKELHNVRRYVTRICSYAILFMGAVILPGLTVGEGAVVKPGSVVTKNVLPWTIVQGNPATIIGERKLKYEADDNLLLRTNKGQLQEIFRASLTPK